MAEIAVAFSNNKNAIRSIIPSKGMPYRVKDNLNKIT